MDNWVYFQSFNVLSKPALTRDMGGGHILEKGDVTGIEDFQQGKMNYWRN